MNKLFFNANNAENPLQQAQYAKFAAYFDQNTEDQKAKYILCCILYVIILE